MVRTRIISVRSLAILGTIGGLICLSASTQAQEVRRRTTVYTPSHDRDDFKMATRWEKGSVLKGRKVVSTSNEELGTIEDVVVDPASGRTVYGVVSFGPSVGVGDKYYAIPWQTFQDSPDNSTVVLNVERERLKGAPSFERTSWPRFDRDYAVTTYKYYDVPPYWDTDERETRTVTERTSDNRTAYGERWYEPPRTWSRTSEIIGMAVRNRQNEDFGQINDVTVDPDTGRILYGIVSYNGKLYSIPWPAFATSSDSKYLIVDMPREQFTRAYSFESTSWPTFTDEPWATKTYTYYKVEPYWTTEYKTKVKHGKVEIKEKRVKHKD